MRWGDLYSYRTAHNTKFYARKDFERRIGSPLAVLTGGDLRLYTWEVDREYEPERAVADR